MYLQRSHKCSLFFIPVVLILILIGSLEAADKFIVYAPPKCGTHLIGKALELMLEQKSVYMLSELEDPINKAEAQAESGGFIVAHNWSSEVLHQLVGMGYRVVFVVRDPRDQVISMQDWMLEGNWDWLRVAALKPSNAQLQELITGARYGWRCVDGCLLERYRILLSLPEGSYYVVHFEKLVGEEGGGSRQEQFVELSNLASFLTHAASSRDLDFVADNLYGGTRTFRSGQIGRWKERFNLKHHYSFRERYGPLLIELGYEKSLEW